MKNTGGARHRDHSPPFRRGSGTHRRVQGVVGQVQAEVVPLGQLQVLEDDVKQHLAMIRLLHRGTGGREGGEKQQQQAAG